MGAGIDCTIRGLITDETPERAGSIKGFLAVAAGAVIVQQPASVRVFLLSATTAAPRIQTIDLVE